MGTTALRQLLRSLCHNSQWKYAVFWKLKHQNRMLLTWEDGYCDYPKPREPLEGMSDNVYSSETTGITSFDCDISAYNGCSVGYSIRLAVASMSCLLYSFGEGVVGRVASAGKHCWVFTDKINSELLPEYSDEWQLQFAAGIKTILLVPVVPHGVVQLGSLETVTEDPMLVAQIKDTFNTLQHVPGPSMPLNSSRDLLSPPPSLLTSLLLENLAEPSSTSGNLLIPIQSEIMLRKDPMALDGIQITKNSQSPTSVHIMSQLMGQDNLLVQGKKMQHILGSVRDAELGALSVGPSELPFPQNQFTNANHLKMMGSNVPNFSCLEEDLRASFQCNLTQLGFEAHTNMSMNCSSSDYMMDQSFGDKIGESDHKSVCGFLSFPADSELHKALGPSFQQECDEYLWDPTVLGEDVCSSSSLICHTELTRGIKPLVGEPSGLFVKGDDVENLLDAVVANVHSASDDTASIRSNSVRSPTISSGQFAASCQTQNQSGCSALLGDDSGPWSYVRSAFASGSENVLSSSPSGSSLKTMVSTLIKDEQQKKGFGNMLSRRGAKLSHIGKRRAKPGDVQRPRPRDRQMIQDRVKELRELVPNGAKCSIDALLDRTVKHMLFLRSVTNQAEKLKQCVYPKVDRKKPETSETQDHQNGASWAFELGSQIGVCPIVVEDLDHPGRMLIEMLCEEQGLFLEIAKVIRHLELTILKGVMENRSDKIWAHFIVEASRGFQRMTIFWPLMQLLQRNNPAPSMP